MAKSLYLLALAFIASSEVVYGIEEWTIGNFTKQDAVNPVMGPRDNTTFLCSVRQEIVNWEKKDVFNPTALVRDAGTSDDLINWTPVVDPNEESEDE
ncbi:hypothetical protein Ocin01_19854, partial [Orchesella cincta]